MQSLRLGMATLVATLIAFTPAFAQRVEQQPRKGVLVGRGEAPLLTPEALEKLKFSGEQKEKYAKIETSYAESTKAAQAKFREDIAGLNDRTKYRELFEKMQETTKKSREDHLARVEPILNADQKTIFAQVKVQQRPQPGAGVRPGVIQFGGGIGQVLPAGLQQRLQLTEDQKKEIEKIQKEVEAKILKVLNDDQKKQLEQLKKGPGRVRPAQPATDTPRVRPATPRTRQAPDVKKD